MFYPLPGQITNVPSLQLLASRLRVSVGPSALPGSEIPQICTEHPLCKGGGVDTSAGGLCCPGWHVAPPHWSLQKPRVVGRALPAFGVPSRTGRLGLPQLWLQLPCGTRTGEDGRMGWGLGWKGHTGDQCPLSSRLFELQYRLSPAVSDELRGTK